MKLDPPLSINIIGAGTVAKTLVRVWRDYRLVSIGGVVNRSLNSGEAAVQFWGAGKAHSTIGTLPDAQLWLIGCNDDAIDGVADGLSGAARLDAKSVVFHLSGNLSSRSLVSLQSQTQRLASLHPLKSFPDSESSYQRFGKPYCIVEGQPAAVDILAQLCHACDCPTATLDAAQKPIYHLANTLLSNGLIGLLDVGLSCYREAGIDPIDALAMATPLLTETLSNGLELGPEAALTGPVVRGDKASVERHIQHAPEQYSATYRALSQVMVDIAVRSGRLSAEVGEQLRHLLGTVDG